MVHGVAVGFTFVELGITHGVAVGLIERVDFGFLVKEGKTHGVAERSGRFQVLVATGFRRRVCLTRRYFLCLLVVVGLAL